MGNRTAVRALLLLALTLPAARPSRAAPAAGSPAGRETLDEFLLFWDEKDLYVESATRSERPLSQVAENVTVITAQELEDQHAHTVAEALNRVTGVFVAFQGRDFLSPSTLLIQGSGDRHALVLVDGVPWNFLSDSHAETLTIPTAIIDRIEVVKGPGSSAWGSSLGGVFNVITKAPGSSPIPRGTVSASYGERNTQDDHAELTGAAGPLGYYLYAGHRESDGLRLDRHSLENDAYAKLRLPLGEGATLGFTAGHAEADLKVLEIPELQISQKGTSRPTFGTLSLDAGLAQGLRLSLSAYVWRVKYANKLEDTGSGSTLVDRTAEERSEGGSGKLVWVAGRHTVVAGADISRGELDQDWVALPSDPEVKKWAVFANDTLSIGGFTLTPGYRYDHNNISGVFHSPSLGVTYRAGEHTVLRAFGARGFTYPPVVFTSVGDGAFLLPNPDLKPEKVWSAQFGGETDLGGRLWLKATAFYHRQTDAIERVLNALGPDQDRMENVGKVTTRGVELDAETAPVFNLSLKVGAAYVDLDPVPEAVSTGRYSYSVALAYDDRASWKGQLFGLYKRWLVEPESTARSNGIVWDAVVSKRFPLGQGRDVDLYVAGHNLFNASEYSDDLFPNPRRWVEGGVRIGF